MYIEIIEKVLNKFELYYKNEIIKIDEFDKKMINYFEQNKKNEKLNIFTFPKDNRYIVSILIIYYGFKQYLTNIYANDNDILDEVRDGDILEFSKARCKYLNHDNNYMYLKFQDLSYNLPINLRYKVTIYKGSAKKLNKYPTNTNRGSKKTKSIVSSLLDIETELFSKVIKDTILIIAQKEMIYNLVNNTKIKYDNKVIFISEIFPSAYYTSFDNYQHFKGNSSKREPILKFTSNICTARDIVRSNNKVKHVMTFTNKIDSEDLSDLEVISRRKNIKDIKIISDFYMLEKMNSVYEMDTKFNLNILSSDYLKKIIQLSEFKNSIKRKQLILLNNYTFPNVKIKQLSDEVFYKQRKMIIQRINYIVNLFREDKLIMEYVIKVRTLLKILSELVVPIEAYNSYLTENGKYKYSLINRLSEIEGCLDEISNEDYSTEVISKAKEINCGINKMYIHMHNKNQKYFQLKIVLNNICGKVAIVVEDNRMRDILKNQLGDVDVNNIYINKFNKINGNIYDVIIYTGNLSEKSFSLYNCYNGKKIIYLFHKHELNIWSYLNNRYKKIINNMNLGEILEYTDEEKFIQKFNEQVKEVREEIEILDNIDRLIAVNYIPLDNKYSQAKKVVCEKVVTFNNNMKAFLTKNHNIYVLKERKAQLEITDINKIEKGDTLVFIDGLEKDLIEDILCDLLEIDKIRKEYLRDYQLSKEWKTYLELYMVENEFKSKDIENRLKKYGVFRNKVTISNWLKDNVVGPQEEEIFTKLGVIIGEDKLKNNASDYYNACNNIRSIQIRIRKLAALVLLDFTDAKDNDIFDNLIRNKISNSMKFIKKVEIDNIYNVRKEVPSYLTNKLIEG